MVRKDYPRPEFLLQSLGQAVALLVDLLFVAAFATPSAQTFTPYSTVTGQYTLGIDLDSMKVVSDQNDSMVLVDIEIVFDKPVKYFDSPTLVKSYQNSLSVDCTNDRVFVIVARSFDAKRRLIYSTQNVQIVKNPHDELSPTTQIMTLVCAPTNERNTLPPGVTTSNSQKA